MTNTHSERERERRKYENIAHSTLHTRRNIRVHVDSEL